MTLRLLCSLLDNERLRQGASGHAEAVVEAKGSSRNNFPV
jgi:hypothetical protein